jgi:hypothetical protein
MPTFGTRRQTFHAYPVTEQLTGSNYYHHATWHPNVRFTAFS